MFESFLTFSLHVFQSILTSKPMKKFTNFSSFQVNKKFWNWSDLSNFSLTFFMKFFWISSKKNIYTFPILKWKWGSHLLGNFWDNFLQFWVHFDLILGVFYSILSVYFYDFQAQVQKFEHLSQCQVYENVPLKYLKERIIIAFSSILINCFSVMVHG